MPVRKHFGYPGGPTSPIVRHAFVGDPATMTWPEENPEPITARGRRRSQRTEEYNKNLDERMKQRAPCDPTRPVHKGPRHRQKGMGNTEWANLMNKKFDFDY